MKNIVLVGFMGTGKSVVGKKLAEKLNQSFIELDEEIEKREGESIKEIFENKGEAYFRKLEKKIVTATSEKESVVISAGGGAVVDEENFNNLKKNGIIICLQASPEMILNRTKGKKCRPLLNVGDPKKRIEELLEKRMPYYKKADFCIDTDKLSVEELVDKIVDLIKK